VFHTVDFTHTNRYRERE